MRAVQVRGELLDWTQPYNGPKVDIVLACDVLYEVNYLFLIWRGIYRYSGRIKSVMSSSLGVLVGHARVL